MKRAIDRFILAMIIVFSLLALWLVLNAPASYLNIHAVYQGF